MSQLPSDALLDDIETLFCAVSARLRRVADGPVEPIAAPEVESIGQLRAAVLECVTALDQLQSMLSLEIERRSRLEQMINDAQAALASAPPELAAMFDIVLGMPPLGRRSARSPEAARAS